MVQATLRLAPARQHGALVYRSAHLQYEVPLQSGSMGEGTKAEASMTDFPIIQKPPFRAPCNRCGQCCQAGPCELAHNFLHVPDNTPCTALEIEPDGRFSCGLYKRPLHYLSPQLPTPNPGSKAEAFIALTRTLVGDFLAFGQGCGMED
jgi:hypothetical protein